MNDIFTDAKTILLRVLEEDIGDGDITTLCTVPREAILKGTFIAKSPGVTAGLEIAGLTFSLLNEQVQFTPHIADGDKVKTGQVIATVSGPGRAILSGERVALNLLQRMSGIATLTREFSDAVEGTSAIILDTRKTVPGFACFLTNGQYGWAAVRTIALVYMIWCLLRITTSQQWEVFQKLSRVCGRKIIKNGPLKLKSET